MWAGNIKVREAPKIDISSRKLTFSLYNMLLVVLFNDEKFHASDVCVFCEKFQFHSMDFQLLQLPVFIS